MEDELVDLNNNLISLYLKNLEFLKKNHKKIYDKVEFLSENIQNGTYKEKYSLEYKEEGYFDILNLETNEFIYGFNSYQEADKRRDLANFKKTHSLDLLRVDPNTQKFALMGSLGDTTELVTYLNGLIDFKDITFSKIFKYIFIGVGVGVHIHEIYKKINSMNTLIIEPEIELFRLSLFTIDYSIFEEGNKKLFISIGHSETQRQRDLEEFTNYHGYMNYNIKHHLFWIEYEYILNEIIDFYSHTHAAAFSYGIILQVFTRTIDFMHRKFNFLKKNLVEEVKPLKDKKVLIVSGGPSVDKHIDWIYENQDKFIILCVDVILKKLESHKITPDIVVSIDPSHLVADFFKTQDKDFLKNSAIIFLSQQEESVIETVKDLNVYFSQVFYLSEELGYSFSLPNVGTFSLAISLFLNANELYLVGSDAAFDQETGSRYSKGSSVSQTHDLKSTNNLVKEGIISSDDILEVKGNLREKVKTNRSLLTFKRDYESYLHGFDREKNVFNIYNLSDGAYIEGLIPTKVESIDTKSLKEKDFNAKEIIDSISISDISDIKFEDDILIINRIINKVSKFKKQKVSNKDDFLKKKLDIMIWILEQNKIMSKHIFGNIFLKFIELIDIYINFTLNLKQEGLNSPKNLNSIKNYWSDALIKLLKELKQAIKDT